MTDFMSGQSCVDDQVGGRTERTCGPCLKKDKRTTAKVFCNTCLQYQCSECATVHEKFSFMSGHDIEPVGDEKQDGRRQDDDDLASGSTDALESLTLSSDFESSFTDVTPMDMTGLDACENHRKLFEIYCKDHDKLCCSLCAIEFHKSCKEVKAIDKYVRDVNFEPSDLLVEMMAACSTAAALQKRYKHSRESIERNKKEIPEVMKKIQECTTTHINNMQTEVMAEAFKEKSKFLGELEEKQKICDKMLQELDELLQAFKKVVESGSVEMIFIAYHKIQTVLKQFEKETKKIDSELFDVDVCLQFDDQLSTLLNTTDDFVTVHIDKSISEGGPLPVIRPLKQTHILTSDAKQDAGLKGSASYVAMDFLRDGKLIAAESINNVCVIFDDKLVKLETCKLECTPQGLAVLSNNTFAISGSLSGLFSRSRYLQIYEIDTNSKITMTKSHTINDDFGQIWCMNIETILAVTVGDKRVVRKFDLQNGSTTDLKFPLNDKKYEKENCAIAYLNTRDTIVLSDKAEDAVLYFNMQGKATETKTVKDGAIKGPTGLCVGPLECIFVCSAHNIIVQISPTARVICYYPLHVQLPTAISATKDCKKMVVFGGTNEEKKIQLFSLE
ncbi:uncharacterized protein LOC128225698 [Mya arenaria]|uniref:uncharacterized protein LOC128225698 n=1 Tax=Mya arenaria TaxID=6604 RepID=UPI0022E7D495|nr:uncharacterized protein LOC128225698 [Mya arenaria]